MAQHKALTAALRMLKKRGLTCMRSGALEILACSKEYNPRPLYVRITCSAHADNLARLSVSWLHDTHSDYALYSPLDGLEFEY
jgi:hypothetical protein